MDLQLIVLFCLVCIVIGFAFAIFSMNSRLNDAIFEINSRLNNLEENGRNNLVTMTNEELQEEFLKTLDGLLSQDVQP